MRFLSFTIVLLVCLQLAIAQTDSNQAPAPTQAPAATPAAPGTTPPQPRPKVMPRPDRRRAVTATPNTDATRKIPPDTAVITIAGLCSSSAPKPKTATTAAAAKSAECPPMRVTKAQLESVIESVRPNLPSNQRLPLAQQYVQLLTIANAAQKAGMENDPKVKQELQLQKLQILASAYSKQLAQKASEIPDSEIEKYYSEHRPQYQQLKLQRIYIPSAMTADGKPADQATSKALADKIQKRAAAGEDFEKLQKAAFEEANNKNTPPSVDMGERRRGSLPAKQEAAVFDLNAGDVSPLYDESSGFYVYKVVSKEVMPLDKVKDEIKSTIGRERFRDKMDQLKANVKPAFNPAYFGAGDTPPMVMGGAPHPNPAAPAAPETTPAGAPQAAAPQAPAAAQPATGAQPPAPSTEAPQTPPQGPPSK